MLFLLFQMCIRDRYKNRKAEAEKKLETTSANLERINDIIGEIEGRIDHLREDSQKACLLYTSREFLLPMRHIK